MSDRTDPSRSLRAITPSDTAELSYVRALYVGGAGDVSVMAAGDSSAVVLSAVPAGTVLPISASRVMATGTTATNIVGLI